MIVTGKENVNNSSWIFETWLLSYVFKNQSRFFLLQLLVKSFSITIIIIVIVINIPVINYSF